ncbi:hypothetical protein CVT26_012593 [Gymnopilus dilepis]|uniref:Uncharacterized protein n=1 Tax=Gymnopilus dilepis TaxID=231916 RepID=A0A409WMN7_9AGAR|nr:hypothetical protein CVT26_012593 [Gymnopilus dilepis]
MFGPEILGHVEWEHERMAASIKAERSAVGSLIQVQFDTEDGTKHAASSFAGRTRLHYDLFIVRLTSTHCTAGVFSCSLVRENTPASLLGGFRSPLVPQILGYTSFLANYADASRCTKADMKLCEPRSRQNVMVFELDCSWLASGCWGGGDRQVCYPLHWTMGATLTCFRVTSSIMRPHTMMLGSCYEL